MTRRDQLIAILVSLFCVSILSLTLVKGYHADKAIPYITEEHYQIGREFYSSGKLYLYDQPSTFRPPGYPAFVAMSLHARDAILYFVPLPSSITEDAMWIVVSQVLLLFHGSQVFYFAIRLWLPQTPSLLLVSAYILNPFSHTAIRTLSYAGLDSFFITVLILLCCLLLLRKTSPIQIILYASILAIGALVRPVFLTAPLLVFALLIWARSSQLKKL